MPTAAPEITDACPLIFESISFLGMAKLCVDGFAEHPIMPPETRNIIWGLNQKAKQIQKRRGVSGLWVERIEIRSFYFGWIATAAAPFAVEIQTFPTVADGGPDLAPSGLRSQHVNHHPSAVAAGFIAV